MTRSCVQRLLAVFFAIGVGASASAQDHDWPMYQHDARRTGFNAAETKINRTSAGLLRLKCAFHAGDSITASPVVIDFADFDGQGPRKVVYVGSADEKFYAIDAADCSEIWHFQADPAPGIGYNMFVGSAFVDRARGRLYVAGGFTLYALDLFGKVRDGSGGVAPIWKWTTGRNPSGATHGGGEIESSPLVVGDRVYFGSDLDGAIAGVNPLYPALFAVNADTGALEWYWRPSEIGSCGDVWSSVAADPELGLLYFDTSDCGTGHQGLYNESVIALPIAPTAPLDGERRTDAPSWYHQPRDVDPYDYDFGSSPLLFDRGGAKYLGVGGKDGFYYVMPRDAAAVAGTYRDAAPPSGWKTRVVRGGFAGGFIGSTATDGDLIWGGTALLDTPPGPNPQAQPPYLHAFDAATGSIVWQQVATGPTFAPTTAAPGVVFVGSTDGIFSAVDALTGQLLFMFPGIGAISSGAAISDGEVFVGAGTTAKAYGLGEGPLNALLVFALPDGAPAADPNVPPPLPPATWPLGVVEYPAAIFPDGTTPATPTP
jgi:outer membrane protein assembly factor BamB